MALPLVTCRYCGQDALETEEWEHIESGSERKVVARAWVPVIWCRNCGPYTDSRGEKAREEAITAAKADSGA